MRQATIDVLNAVANDAGLVWLPKDGITLYTDHNGTLTRVSCHATATEAIAYMQGYAAGKSTT